MISRENKNVPVNSSWYIKLMCGYTLTAQLKHSLDMIKRVENFSKTDLSAAREKLFEDFFREILKNYNLG